MATQQLAYTPDQAADVTGFSVETIRAAIRAGDLPAIRPEINGRKLKRQHVLHDDLMAWLRGET